MFLGANFPHRIFNLFIPFDLGERKVFGGTFIDKFPIGIEQISWPHNAYVWCCSLQKEFRFIWIENMPNRHLFLLTYYHRQTRDKNLIHFPIEFDILLIV